MEKIKQAMKRTLAMLMVVIMLICAAPLDLKRKQLEKMVSFCGH